MRSLPRLPSSGSLRDKRILVRIDANVPLRSGRILPEGQEKLARAARDLIALRKRGARLIILTHLGRPKRTRDASLSTKVLVPSMSKLLSHRVMHVSECIGPRATRAASELRNGDMLLLENLRFEKGEEKNSKAFAKSLSRLGDLFINDAFAVCHRAHASVAGLPFFLPSFAGTLLVEEVHVLSRLRDAPRHPFLLCLGGSKLETKLPLLHHLLPRVDTVLLGGLLVAPFLKAQGFSVGATPCRRVDVLHARELLSRFPSRFALPEELVVLRGRRVLTVPASALERQDVIMDIAPSSIEEYATLFTRAKTILWNGPFGNCEDKRFAKGSHALATRIAERTGKARTVVGGGETIATLSSMTLDNFSWVSTGGGALLTFLSGQPMPGFDALFDS